MPTSGAPPEILYHYTDIHGLIGILREGKIRATVADLMNDRAEVGLGHSVIAKVLAEDEEMQELASNLREHMDDDKWFVSCFSEVEDDLSMWRWYGAGQGYALGIRTQALQQASRGEFTNTPAELHCVQYGVEAFEEELRAVIRPGISEVERPGAWELFKRAALVKDARWSSEREWRLLAFHHTLDGMDDEKELIIRASPRGPIPYIDLAIWQADGGSPEAAVDSVWIGPGGDQEDRHLGVQVLLRAAGLRPSSDLKIRVSDAPLRL